MFFAATDNLNIVGYNFEIVAFVSKEKRDEFVKNEGRFHAVTEKQAKEHEAYSDARTYAHTVFNSSRNIVGMAFWTYGGEYVGIM